ncbi:trimethylamine methyltransferase family protein [Pelagibius sp. Alg239-R121]|uniref:trimethylamine methyltransferase family protein n=1 Tax=Pelagibius sp. Alg239-R121 TaxID=2993448 RepID=UPI0024A6857C|nr:trimethylamine methyltransferase family protein [Pelagibius sp. Alg239-R121]
MNQSSAPRRGSSRRERRSAAKNLTQLPWRQVINPYPPMEILSADQLETIHLSSLRILQELGIEVVSDHALDVFEKAGGEIDRATNTVRLDPELVMTAISSAPAKFALTPRNPERQILLGGNHLNFSMVAGPPNVHDRERGRRSGNYDDYCNFIRLAHHFNVVHLIGNQVVAPIELPANSRHLDAYDANITYADLCYLVSAIGRNRALDGIAMMAISRGLTLDEIRKDPGVMTIISVNSPRKFDDAMAEGLMTMAEYGQPVAVTPFTLMGAMTPVTIAAGLAQQNAEALFGIALTQLVNPGAPVMYGAYTSNVDMRSGAPAFGTPENTKANIASGQLARKYNLPYRCSPTNASNAADSQATYETEMALWGCVLGHGNLLYHAAGWLEGGLTASYEKFVLDVEMLQNMVEFLEPIKVDEAELGFDAIKSVPTGGHFFGTEHTMERYEDAFYQPLVSNWQNYENWEQAGSQTAEERATDIWKQALQEYEQPAMDPAIREELDAYMARRREEIGDGEP